MSFPCPQNDLPSIMTSELALLLIMEAALVPTLILTKQGFNRVRAGVIGFWRFAAYIQFATFSAITIAITIAAPIAALPVLIAFSLFEATRKSNEDLESRRPNALKLCGLVVGTLLISAGWAVTSLTFKESSKFFDSTPVAPSTLVFNYELPKTLAIVESSPPKGFSAQNTVQLITDEFDTELTKVGQEISSERCDLSHSYSSYGPSPRYDYDCRIAELLPLVKATEDSSLWAKSSLNPAARDVVLRAALACTKITQIGEGCLTIAKEILFVKLDKHLARQTYLEASFLKLYWWGWILILSGVLLILSKALRMRAGRLIYRPIAKASRVIKAIGNTIINLW